MAKSKQYEFNSFLIKSINPAKQGLTTVGNHIEQEDVVFHYPGPDAFLSIIQRQEIRFTDIRYLNDRSEGIYFIKLLLDFLEKNAGKYPSFEESITQLLKGNDLNKIRMLDTTEVHFNDIPNIPYKAERVFVFCACAEPDLLNMWNYYVNNGSYQGYNIGLRTKELLDTFDTPSKHAIDAFQVYYGNVLYDEIQQMSEIRRLANSIEQGINCSSDKEIAIDYAQITLKSYINAQGAFYKHPKFKEEHEFRIILEIADDRIPRSTEDAAKYWGINNKKLVEGFCTKRGLIVPYISVALPDRAISRVTVAPMIEYSIARLSIQELLETKGLLQIPIHKSEIPIRF